MKRSSTPTIDLVAPFFFTYNAVKLAEINEYTVQQLKEMLKGGQSRGLPVNLIIEAFTSSLEPNFSVKSQTHTAGIVGKDTYEERNTPEVENQSDGKLKDTENIYAIDTKHRNTETYFSATKDIIEFSNKDIGNAVEVNGSHRKGNMMVEYDCLEMGSSQESTKRSDTFVTNKDKSYSVHLSHDEKKLTMKRPCGESQSDSTTSDEDEMGENCGDSRYNVTRLLLQPNSVSSRSAVSPRNPVDFWMINAYKHFAKLLSAQGDYTVPQLRQMLVGADSKEIPVDIIMDTFIYSIGFGTEEPDNESHQTVVSNTNEREIYSLTNDSSVKPGRDSHDIDSDYEMDDTNAGHSTIEKIIQDRENGQDEDLIITNCVSGELNDIDSISEVAMTSVDNHIHEALSKSLQTQDNTQVAGVTDVSFVTFSPESSTMKHEHQSSDGSVVSVQSSAGESNKEIMITETSKVQSGVMGNLESNGIESHDKKENLVVQLTSDLPKSDKIKVFGDSNRVVVNNRNGANNDSEKICLSFDSEQIGEMNNDLSATVQSSDQHTHENFAIKGGDDERALKDESSVFKSTPIQLESDAESESSSVVSSKFRAVLQNEKFQEIEEVDDNQEIDAFLTRLSVLKAGGHFKDANLENIGYEIDQSNLEEKDAIEVDAVHGFVNKDLHTVELNLNEEELMWSDFKEKDLFVKHADFLKKLPLPVEIPNKNTCDDDPPTESILKQHVAEYRDVNNGDAEVYLMEESQVEVAFVDEEEEMRATEKSRNKVKWEFGAEFKKSLHRQDGVVLGRRVSPKSSSFSRSTFYDYSSSEHPKLKAIEETLEKNLRVRDEKLKKMGSMDNWVSPWERTKPKAIRQGTVKELLRMGMNRTNLFPSGQKRIAVHAPPINAVAASTKLIKYATGRYTNVKQRWRIPFDERVRGHNGYYFIDVNSLYDASDVIGDWHRFDHVPWQDRDVRQRFLFEKSLAYARNWFGELKPTRLNDKLHQPVCHPKSMEMPMEEKMPDPGEWTEDWFTTWQSRKQNPNNLILYTRDQDLLEDEERSDHGDEHANATVNSVVSFSGDIMRGALSPSRAVPSTPVLEEEEEEENDAIVKPEWEETPQVGTLCTLRLKIGEKVSRVKWDYTSHLRRSRWRRKHFPNGNFPYDNLIVQNKQF